MLAKTARAVLPKTTTFMAEQARAAAAEVRYPGFKKGVNGTAQLTASEDKQNTTQNVTFVTTPTNSGITGDSPSPKYYSPMGLVSGTGAIPKEKRIKKTKTITQIPTIEQKLMEITGQREEDKSSSSEEESDSDPEIKTYTYNANNPNKTVLNFRLPEYTLVQPKKNKRKMEDRFPESENERTTRRNCNAFFYIQ